MNTKPDITYTPADRQIRVPRLSGGFRATAQVKTMLRNKWPEAIPDNYDQSRLLFQSGLEPFDRLFPESGIPYGQLVEISGGPSCGKTGLLLHILAGLTKTMHVAYVDTGGMFFPGAAAACGVDLARLVVVNTGYMVHPSTPLRVTNCRLRMTDDKLRVTDRRAGLSQTCHDGTSGDRRALQRPLHKESSLTGGAPSAAGGLWDPHEVDSGAPQLAVGSLHTELSLAGSQGSCPTRMTSLHHTMRTTELMLQHKMVGCVICDLVGQRDILPIAWCHRLRIRTVRARGLVIFITENNSHLIPPSMVSLRLEIERKDIATVAVTVAKSRISPEGARAEVMFGGV